MMDAIACALGKASARGKGTVMLNEIPDGWSGNGRRCEFSLWACGGQAEIKSAPLGSVTVTMRTNELELFDDPRLGGSGARAFIYRINRAAKVAWKIERTSASTLVKISMDIEDVWKNGLFLVDTKNWTVKFHPVFIEASFAVR